MKKILISSNTSWFIYNFFRTTIKEFMGDGRQVYILAPKDAYSEKLSALGCHFYPMSVDRSGAKLTVEFKTILQFYSTIKIIKPDCLLNFTPKMNIYGAVIGRLLNIPVINSVAGLGSIFTEKGFKPRIGKLLLRLTQPLVNHIIFQNPDDRQVYLEHHFVKAKHTSRVHGIGIDLKSFKAHSAPDDNVVRFILVARMLKNKGVIEFVKVAERIRDKYLAKDEASSDFVKCEFSLLGFIDEDNPQGISRSTLIRWDQERNVRYLGKTDDVYSVVKNYDCVVLPSYYREGIPQCLIEACAMAKPVITTDNVGCRETVEDQITGIKIPCRNVEALEDAMQKIIDMSHQERLNLGINGRLKAEKEFCHLNIAKHYLLMIDALLSNKKTK
ncbi:glycosyltransferase family 4 protein [Psychromonas sp. KJ10-10]|uniref:glycosyltransferase family 4 protein n=1 Tax=Psychromonas sp. KJ10-10 TaxID=3391823 RepID=UPI0039B414CE